MPFSIRRSGLIVKSTGTGTWHPYFLTVAGAIMERGRGRAEWPGSLARGNIIQRGETSRRHSSLQFGPGIDNALDSILRTANAGNSSDSETAPYLATTAGLACHGRSMATARHGKYQLPWGDELGLGIPMECRESVGNGTSSIR